MKEWTNFFHSKEGSMEYNAMVMVSLLMDSVLFD